MKQMKKAQSLAAIGAATLLMTAVPDDALAGLDPFLGEISYVGFNYAPSGWMKCDGQTLSISQNAALFSLLGATYGGDGVTTFKLPDMRGRVAIHQGQSPGYAPYTLGQSSGQETITLTAGNLPAHTHPATATSTSTSTVAPGATATSTLKAANSDINTNTAQGNSLGNAARGSSFYSTTAPSISMNAASIETTLSGLAVNTTTTTNVIVEPGPAGTPQSFPVMQPYTVVNCIIATDGNYPPHP